jgi:hypothetical protein
VKKYVFILLTILLTSFTTRTETKSFPETTTSKTIALKSYKHLHYITVMINGKKANLLLDTGAAWTIWDINYAENYGFKYHTTSVEMIGVGGKKQRFNLSNYKVHHDDAPLLMHSYGADLKELTKSFSENGVDIIGVIGSDFFTTCDVVIDYKNKQMIINK